MNVSLTPSPSRPVWRQAALASLLLVVFTFAPPPRHSSNAASRPHRPGRGGG